MAELITAKDLQDKYPSSEDSMKQFMQDHFPPAKPFTYPEGTDLLRHVSRHYEPEQKLEFTNFMLGALNSVNLGEKGWGKKCNIDPESQTRKEAVTLLHTLLYDLVHNEQMVQAPPVIVGRMAEAIKEKVNVKEWEEKWPEMVEIDRGGKTHHCSDFTQELATAICEEFGVIAPFVRRQYLSDQSGILGASAPMKSDKFRTPIQMAINGNFRKYIDTSIHEITHHLVQFDEFMDSPDLREGVREAHNSMMGLSQPLRRLWDTKLHKAPENLILKFAIYADSPEETLVRQVARDVTSSISPTKHGEANLNPLPDNAFFIGATSAAASLTDSKRKRKFSVKEMAKKFEKPEREIEEIFSRYYGRTSYRGL